MEWYNKQNIKNLGIEDYWHFFWKGVIKSSTLWSIYSMLNPTIWSKIELISVSFQTGCFLKK